MSWKERNREKVNANAARWRRKNIEKALASSRRNRMNGLVKLRADVFGVYGTFCKCCGEDILLSFV
jgi:hypothetical protein